MNRRYGVITWMATWFLLVLSGTSAQQTGIWELIDATDMQYFGNYQDVLAAADDHNYAMIGTRNTMYLPRMVRTTTDGGATWNLVRSDTGFGESWAAIAHPDPDLIVVVGDTSEILGFDGANEPRFRYRGVLLLSTDGGATWSRRVSDTNVRYGGVSMCDPQHGLILQWNIGNADNAAPDAVPDSLLRTADGWKTWSTIPLPDGLRGSPQVICLAPDVYVARVFDAAGQQFRIIRTTDGGAHWTTSAPLPQGCDHVSFIDAGHGWGAGGVFTGAGDRRRDMICRSTDGGMSWTVVLDQEIGVLPFGLMGIDFADADNGIAVGGGNKILRTTDGGTTWTQEFPPSDIVLPFPIRYIEYLKPDLAVAAYNGAAIIKYSGGRTLLPPTFVRPASEGPFGVNPITVAWTRIEGADEYHIRIAPKSLEHFGYDSTAYEHAIVDMVTADTSVVLNDPAYNTSYYCRVKSLNTTQESDWHRREGLFYTVKDAGAGAPPMIPASTSGAPVVVPNPVAGNALVELGASFTGRDVRLTIHDALGRMVRSVPATEGRAARFDAFDLPAGTYRLRAISDGRCTSVPFVVVR